MYAFKTRTLGQVAVAVVLSMGLTAGAVGIASAATHPANTTSHTSAKTAKTVAFQSVVTTVSATSVTALSAKGGKVAKCLIVVRDCTHPTRQRQHVKGRIAESLGEEVTTDTQKHELTFSQDPYLRRHRMVTSMLDTPVADC